MPDEVLSPLKYFFNNDATMRYITMGVDARFLQAATHITKEDTTKIIAEAACMKIFGEYERAIEGETYAGKIKTEGKLTCLMGFVGQLYEVELQTYFGTDKASFIINERDAFSKN